MYASAFAYILNLCFKNLCFSDKSSLKNTLERIRAELKNGMSHMKENNQEKFNEDELNNTKGSLCSLFHFLKKAQVLPRNINHNETLKSVGDIFVL